MEPKFIFRYKMNKEFFAQMVRVQLSRVKTRGVYLAMVIIMLITTLIESATAEPFFIFSFLLFLLFLFYYAFYERLFLKNTLKINETLVDRNSETVFTDEGVEQNLELKYIRDSYAVFTEILETDDNFCLFEGRSKIALIPKKSIAEGDLTQFRDFIEGKTGKRVAYLPPKKRIKNPVLFTVLCSVAALFAAAVCFVGGIVYDGLDCVYDFEDYSITLTNGFVFEDVYKSNEFNAYFDDSVYVSSYYYSKNSIREYYGYLPDVEEYAHNAIDGSAYDITDVEYYDLENGAVYVTYRYTDYDGYYCDAYVEASDGYWYFEFSCSEEEKEDYEDRFKEWAGSITVYD